ncbi:MAG: hypothetical protein JXB39_00655 [Deltaproteobacteria bacterium]|nr:hypothetical protein [Deltaproteobacteria bacterium]
MRRSRTLLAWLLGMLVLLAAASLPGDALAQARRGSPAAQAPGKVKVTLLEVAATDSHSGVDPRLAPFSRHLTFLRYKGYDLLDTHRFELSSGGQEDLAITGGRRVQVGLLNRTAQHAQFRIQITSQRGKLLDTTLSVNRNGTFIVAGPKYQDGILILPLQARY